jgi:hypothetical protein
MMRILYGAAHGPATPLNAQHVMQIFRKISSLSRAAAAFVFPSRWPKLKERIDTEAGRRAHRFTPTIFAAPLCNRDRWSIHTFPKKFPHEMPLFFRFFRCVYMC